MNTVYLKNDQKKYLKYLKQKKNWVCKLGLNGQLFSGSTVECFVFSGMWLGVYLSSKAQFASTVNFILVPKIRGSHTPMYFNCLGSTYLIAGPSKLNLELCFNSQPFTSVLVTNPPHCFLTLSSFLFAPDILQLFFLGPALQFPGWSPTIHCQSTCLLASTPCGLFPDIPRLCRAYSLTRRPPWCRSPAQTSSCLFWNSLNYFLATVKSLSYRPMPMGFHYLLAQEPLMIRLRPH